MFLTGASCRIHGDPHHQTLDGSLYTYGGHGCWFDILYHNDDFIITGFYESCFKHKSCVKEISVTYKDVTIRLKKLNTVEVNGVLVDSFPHITSLPAIVIKSEKTGHYKYTIELPNAVLVYWDGHKDVNIKVSLSFLNEVRGKWATFFYEIT